MKVIYVVIFVLAAVGAYYFLTPDEVDTPTSSTEQVSETKESQDIATDDVAEKRDAEADSSEKVFNITGKNYEYSMDTITVSEGDTVTINFESTQGFHDWVVDAFDARTERVKAGAVSSVTFVADATGTYEFYCSVGSHRAQGMVGTLVVEAK